MMIKVLYTPTEHAYFFQSMIQPQDNFRVFVCNNYDKAPAADPRGRKMADLRRQKGAGAWRAGPLFKWSGSKFFKSLSWAGERRRSAGRPDKWSVLPA